jgi:hypothetical protein
MDSGCTLGKRACQPYSNFNVRSRFLGEGNRAVWMFCGRLQEIGRIPKVMQCEIR